MVDPATPPPAKPDPQKLIADFCEKEGIDAKVTVVSVPAADGSIIARGMMQFFYKPRS